MAVDPSKTMLLIAAWPEQLVAPELMLWAAKHKFHKVVWYGRRFVECAYNSAVAKLALPSDCGHFIFADHDIRPGPETDPFLQADGPLVACQFDVAHNASWDDPQAMHCGLWRCDRKVLEAIQPPWFQRVLSADGTQEHLCVCMYFREKARRAGFSVVRAGRAKHEP